MYTSSICYTCLENSAHAPGGSVQIGPIIEGSTENLEALVKGICRDVPEEKEDIRVAVKNIIFQEANRKSYTHEKREFSQQLVPVL